MSGFPADSISYCSPQDQIQAFQIAPALREKHDYAEITPDLRATIFGRNATKVYGLSGLRCGWILCERSLAERMRRLSDLFHSSHVFLAEQLSVEAFRRLTGRELDAPPGQPDRRG